MQTLCLILAFFLTLTTSSYGEELIQDKGFQRTISFLETPLKLDNVSSGECEESDYELSLQQTSFYHDSPTKVLASQEGIPLMVVAELEEITTTKLPDDEKLDDFLSRYTEVEYLNDPRFNEGHKQNAKHMVNMLHYYDSGDKEKAFQYLQDHLKDAPTNQKLSFLSTFLGELYRKYDYEKVGNLFVDINDEDLLDSLKVVVNNDPNEKNYKSGVCRQMHLLALTIARRIGLKHSYGASYVSGVGYHLNLYVNNPENPSEMYRLDYSSIVRTKNTQGTQAVAMDRDMSLAGIGVHLWGENHNPVYFVPSQKGLLFNELSGGENSEFSQNMQSERKLIEAKKLFGKDKKFKLFYATLPDNSSSHLYGVAMEKKDQSERLTKDGGFLNYGIGLYGNNRQAQQQSTFLKENRLIIGDISYNEFGGFVRFEPGHSKKFNIGKDFQVTTDNRLILRSQFFVSKYSEASRTRDGQSSSEQNSTSVKIDGNGQILSTLALAHKPSHSEIIVGSDISGQVSDVNNSSGVTLYPRRLFAKAGAELETRLGAVVYMNAGFDLFPLDGTNVMITNSEVGVRDPLNRKNLSFQLLYPIDDDAPGFLYGSRTTAIGSANYNFFDDKLSIGINGHYSPQFTYTERFNPAYSGEESEFKVSSMREDSKDLSSAKPHLETETKSVEKFVPSDYGMGVTVQVRY